MILHINNSEYDYHTLVKVAEMAGLAGLVGFHESEDGYIVSFPDFIFFIWTNFSHKSAVYSYTNDDTGRACVCI